LPHSGVIPISHEGRSITVAVGGGDDGGEFFEVRTVQYLTQDSGTTNASESVPFVEVAHHVDGRYVLINLSTAQARALVHALVRSADAGDCTTGRDSPGSEDEEWAEVSVLSVEPRSSCCPGTSPKSWPVKGRTLVKLPDPDTTSLAIA
jgi:hypothetical protein